MRRILPSLVRNCSEGKLRVARDDALVEFLHVVDHGQHEMQARQVIGAHDFAEAELDGEFGLAHGERAHRDQENDRDGSDQSQQATVSH
jgi:hypothetical protein